MKYIAALTLSLFMLGLMTPNVFSEYVPDWVKNNAGWWATDAISETEFLNAVEFLINEKIIQVNVQQTSEAFVPGVPNWVKNTAGWWAEEKISDNEFLNSMEFLISKSIIQIKAEQSELQLLLQKRENLIDFIWKEDGFPTHFPNSIEQGISDRNFDDLKNLKKIDRITIEMKHGVNSIVYLLHPQELSYNDLIIYHNGHGDYLHDGKKQIRFFLDRGYPVLVFSMPLAGMNSQPVMMLDGSETKLESHNQFKFLESDKFSPISYFVEPITLSLNFIDKNFDYNNYHMVGISGGGWTTVMYPAIDERISYAASVAGSIPLELRVLQSDKGDYEQTLPELYQIANYYDLYVLGSFGADRKLTQIFTFDDECCFASKNLDLSYADEIENRLASLGSGEFEIISIPGTYHIITGKILTSIFLDIDEKNLEKFMNREFTDQDKNYSSTEVKGNMRNSDFANLDSTDARYLDVDLSNSNLVNSIFFSSSLENVNLTNADITNSDFSYSEICRTKIENTIIHNVDFTKSFIYHADFSKSNLKNSNFDMSACINCTFDNIDISEVKISDNNYHPTSFPGSSFKNVDFRNWNHGHVDFSSKIMRGCIFDELTLISNTDLTGANFSGVDLKNIVFTRGYESDKVNLTNVDFSFADLSFHDLRHANLEGANLEGANLEGANLEGANLKCLNHPICLDE